MNYKIVRIEDMTFHHIIKRENSGKLEMNNGALLLPVAHQYLHLIEFKDAETYITLNKIFRIVNNQGAEPTTEQRQIIELILKDFEYTHRWSKDSRGKLLIKQKYLDRSL